MAMSFLTPKILRAEVTEGIDIESAVYLTGDRVSIGTGAGDDLILGSADIAAEHLAFAYDPTSKSWEYFSSDRGSTQVDKGNPRTGKVRAGMWFRIGNDTRIDIRSVPRPSDMQDTSTKEKRPASSDGKAEIPLSIALPVMGFMVLAALFVVFGFGGTSQGETLRTAGWYTGAEPLEPALDICLATGLEQAAENGAVRVAQSAPDALFRAHVALSATDPASAGDIRAELVDKLRETIARAHLLADAGDRLEASRTLRRIENVLPVGMGTCPILTAARYDLAILELTAE